MQEEEIDKKVWVFKRLPKSEYQEHIVYKQIYYSQYIQVRRQHWNLYQSPKDIDDYLIRMKDKWHNPWAR